VLGCQRGRGVIDRVQVVEAEIWAAVMEDHATSARVSRGDYRYGAQRSVLDVARNPIERDTLFERAAQRRGIEQSRYVSAGQFGKHRARAQQATELGRRGQRTQRVAPLQLTPHFQRGRGRCLKRFVCASRKE
jgi:hypothetical protein